MNLNEVPGGILRSPYITTPAVGPELGAIKLTIAPPLIVEEDAIREGIAVLEEAMEEVVK